MASLVEQILAQANAGSAQGAGFGEFALQGQRLGMERERLNLLKQQQERADRREDMLLPLQQQAAQNNLAIQGYQLKDAARQQDLYTKNEAAYSELADFVTKGLEADQTTDPTFGTKIALQIMRHPTLAQDPRALNLLKLYNDSAQTYHQILKAQRPEHQAMSPLGKLQAERQVALDAGDMNAVRQYDAAIAKATTRSGMTVYDPATGNPLVTTGGDPNALTVANKTASQRSLDASSALVDSVNQLEPLISGETFGIQSAVGGLINDKLLAQIPGMENLSSEARAKAGPLVTGIRSEFMKANRSDSNIGVREVAAIEAVIPQPGDPIDSAERARDTYRGLKRAGARKGAIISAKLGQPVPDWSIIVLTPQDIVDLNKAGLLSKQAAENALLKKRNP